MELSDNNRKEIEQRLLDVIIGGLSAKKLSQKDLPQVASYILENLEKVKNQDQLLTFLQDLSKKWNMFENVLISEQSKLKQKTDLNAADEAEALTRKGNVEEALAVTKRATALQK